MHTLPKHELRLADSKPLTCTVEVKDTNGAVYDKITKQEYDLASHVNVWLLFLDGGMRLDGLSDLTQVGIRELKTWALRERLLWVDDEGYYFLYLTALPLIWAAFADKSRACRVHHEVYCRSEKRAEEGSQIREWMEKCASTPRWTKRDKRARLRIVRS